MFTPGVSTDTIVDVGVNMAIEINVFLSSINFSVDAGVNADARCVLTLSVFLD